MYQDVKFINGAFHQEGLDGKYYPINLPFGGGGARGRTGATGPTGPAGPSSEGSILETTVSLTAEQIKTLSSVPVIAIPAPGVGKAIVIIADATEFEPGSEAFADAGTLSLRTNTANADQSISQLNLTVDPYSFVINTIQDLEAGGSIQIIENQPVMIQTDSDSATGNGSLNEYISYKIINLL